MRIQKANTSWYGVIASGGLILLLGILMLCPLVPEGASATDDSIANVGNVGEVANTGSVGSTSGMAGSPVTHATGDPAISMALSPRAELNVTPTTSGVFQASVAKLQVEVTVPEGYEDTGHTVSGYKVYMKALDGNALKGTSSNSSTIEPVAANTNKNNFANNTWGYSLNKTGSAATTFQPVPTVSSMIEESDALTNTYDLTFATKINMDLPSDKYSNSVIVSVVAEPELFTRLTNLTYMQEMTSANCRASQEGDTKQLVDTRDGNKYYVAKMKDGNCWMTQNLALDITTAGLKASDTNITTDWNSSSTYKPKATSVLIGANSSSNTATSSWNLSGIGKNQWVLGTPLKKTSCEVNGATDITTCTKVGFVKIDNTWSPTFEAKEGVFNAPSTDYTGQTTYISLDYEKKEYDPHYLIGNYYQWNTATAGTGGTITSQDAAGSICPKGWQLPGAGASTHPTFNGLLNKYGVSSNLSTTGDNAIPNPSAGLYNIAGAPLYFVRGGKINPKKNILSDFSLVGSYWSSRAYPIANSDAYYLDFHHSVYPSYNNIRYMGRSIRCVAK